MWKNIIKLFRKESSSQYHIYKDVGVYFLVFISVAIFFWWVVPCHKNGFFEIKKGNGLVKIAEDLKKQGFIQMEFPFCFFVSWQKKSREIKPGVYLFTSDDTFLSIAEKVIKGDSQKIKITIPEGFTLKQIDARLAKIGLIQKNELIGLNPENFQFSIFNFQSNPNFQFSSLEGFLFPDTYYFSGREEPEDIAKIFLDNFNKKLSSDLQKEIVAQGKSISDIIIMASLIEKEVRTTRDKKLVAGILWKRLETDMLLQVDCEPKTYQKKGLPVKPICNPGLESINAAVYPEDSEFWYYLSAPTGETIFNKTLEEHNKDKAYYYVSDDKI